MCVSSYLLGAKHGRMVDKGIIPRMPLNSLKRTINDAIEPDKDNALEDGINNIMNYDGDVALKAIKRSVIKGG
jgi:hypothetical protein